MTTANTILDEARRWIAADPDPETRAELQALVDAEARDELLERMGGPLEFGTAGIRGAVGAGSNRMNRAVVIRTTRGLADFLIDREPDAEGPVVVGRDARLSSAQFMEDSVAVLAAAGISVRFFEAPTPTPLVAYAARLLGARAAVVITASHNPPRDNGYKVYDRNGAQIVPPVDTAIAASIHRVGDAVDVPRLRNPLAEGALTQRVPADIFERYLEDLDEARAVPPHEARRPRIVYTPMHGVGGAYVVEALDAAGHHDVHPVEAQFPPDGRFPTVAFPNPEEPGALDLALQLAAEVDADAILANDPDTDRLAAAAPCDGQWRILTGNQIGLLLADFVLEHTEAASPIVINSIVSSPMLSDLAAHHEAKSVQTLTGFKWIWNAALDLEAAGAGRFVFGYEEALGFSVGGAVRDKDGISAAVTFADVMAWAAAEGRTVWDRLEELYRRHGLWVSAQRNVVRPGTEGAEEIAAAMSRLGEAVPARLGDLEVTSVTDFRLGADHRPRYLPATSLVELELGAAGRVLARPSGTEPKLKIYVDLRADLAADDDVWRREAELLEESATLAAELAAFMGLE